MSKPTTKKTSKTSTKPTAATVAAAMGFISKVTGDEFIRDDSPDGAHHAIRATLAVIAGADPSRVLRHSSPNVAWESYVDPTPTATATTEKIGRLLAFAAPVGYPVTSDVSAEAS